MTDESAMKLAREVVAGIDHDSCYSIDVPTAHKIALAAIQATTDEAQKLRREITDRDYMLEAYRQMLGPKGRQVAKMWADQGLVRQHSSWSVDPYSLTGEEVASIHLEWEAAPKTRINNLDAHLKES